MSALGSLVVKLALEYAEYSKGLDKSSQGALKFAQSAQRSFDTASAASGEFFGGVVKGAAAAVASYLSVSAVLGQLRTSIDRMDKIDEMSQKLSINASTLQEVAYAGQMSGLSLEDMAGSLKKLQVNMLESVTGGKEQAAVFKAMGIEVRDASGKLRESDAVMMDVADVFAGLEDGVLKTALAVKLFGKSGTEMVPLLNEGSAGIAKLRNEAKELGGVLDGEALKAAAEFNDQLDRMRTLSNSAFAGLAAASVSPLNDLIQRFIEARKQVDGFLGAIALTADITIDRTQGESYGDIINDANKKIQDLRTSINPLALLGDGGISKQIAAEQARKKVAQAMQAKLALEGSAGYESDAVSRRLKSEGADANAIAAALDTPAKTTAKVTDYERLTRAIAQKTAAEREQLELGRPLGEAERMLSQLYADRASGAIKLSQAELSSLEVSLKRLGVVERQNEAEKLYAEAQVKAEQRITTINDSTAAIRAEIDAYGMLPAEITNATIARLEEQAAMLKSFDGSQQQIDAIEREIAARKELSQWQGKQRVASMVANSSVAKIEVDRKDMLLLTEAFEAGKLTAEEYSDTVSARLGLVADSAKKTSDEMSEFMKQGARNMQDSMSNGFFDIMDGNFKSMGDSFRRTLMKMTADMAASQLNKQLFGADFGNSGKLGSDSWISKGISLIGSFFGGSTPTYNTGGFEGHSWGGDLLSAAGGMDIPAGSNPLTQLHEKEMVLPAEHADVIRSLASGGGAGGMKVSIYNSAQAEVEARPSADGMSLEVFISAIKNSIAEDISLGTGPVNSVLQSKFNLSPAV